MKNLAASVRARLLNLSRSSGQPLASLLEQYATGRFLYRLGRSEYRERFILKGAQLFRLWGGELYRPTRDLDLLGYGDSSEAAVERVFNELVQLPVEPDDGLEWSAVKTSPIRDEVRYGGVRAVLGARLAAARIPLQVDVGFGDAITRVPGEPSGRTCWVSPRQDSWSIRPRPSSRRSWRRRSPWDSATAV